MSAVKDSIDQTQYLTFHIAGEEYAIGILHVKEIIEYNTLTKVPNVASCIRGVINMRGNVVPVIDLAVKFGLPETNITKLTCIVIVEVEQDGEHRVMGVIAESVNQVMDLLPQDIELPPNFGTRVRTDYLRGMGKVGNKFVLILNIDQVLSTNELLSIAAMS